MRLPLPLLLGWLLILIPLSVDQLLSVDLGGYTVRLNYVGAAWVLAWTVAQALLRHPSWRSELRAYVREKHLLPLAGMAIVGFLGTLGSSNTSRSVYFLVWSIGTLAGLPLLARVLERGLGRWVPRTLAAYAAVQCLVITLDFALCAATAGKLHVGRLYYEGVCRPHAWYQEPNYFAIFGLLSSAWIRSEAKADPSPTWRRFYLACLGLLALALLLSTSRLGWIGLAGLVLMEALTLKIPRRLAAGALAGALALALVAAQNERVHFTFASLTRPSGDGSVSDRSQNAQAGLWIFSQRPWIGTGPGAAGAYFVEHGRHHPYFSFRTNTLKVDPERMRNDPLSYSLYLELLTEWGVIGSLFFAATLGMLFRNASPLVITRMAWIVPVVFLTAQTLPRFDLWLNLSLCWTLDRINGSKA